MIDPLLNQEQHKKLKLTVCSSHPAYSCKNCEEQIYLFEEFENEEDENFTDYTGSFRSGNIRGCIICAVFYKLQNSNCFVKLFL